MMAVGYQFGTLSAQDCCWIIAPQISSVPASGFLSCKVLRWPQSTRFSRH